MHYSVLVVVPSDTTRETAHEVVEPLLAPYCENDGDNDDGWWDWFQVGGRWSGLYSEYDPNQDPRNVESCRVCGGAGIRSDAARCNGCHGTGSAVKWPTNWAPVDDDVLPVRVLLNNPGLPRTFAVVTPDGDYLEDRWNGEEFVRDPDWEQTFADALGKHADSSVVVVDVHS